MIGYRKSYRDIFIGIIQIVPFFALCYLYNQMEKYKEAYSYYQKYASSNAPDDEYKQYSTTRLEELKDYAK